MKIVLTGASGRLGRETHRAVLEAGYDVLGIDLTVSESSPHALPVQRLSLLDTDATLQAMQGADIVVHLANHITHFGLPAQQVFSENCTMNVNVCEGARLGGAKLLVFASSVHAFTGGRSPSDATTRSEIRYLPLDGNMPWHCDEVYGLSKICGEQLLQLYARQHGLAGVALRFPRLLHTPPPEMGWPAKDGELLDEAFTWLTFADSARLIVALISRPVTGYRCYFPASPQPWTRDAPIEDLRRTYFADVPLHSPTPLQSFVDLAALQRDTGWSPRD